MWNHLHLQNNQDDPNALSAWLASKIRSCPIGMYISYGNAKDP